MSAACPVRELDYMFNNRDIGGSLFENTRPLIRYQNDLKTKLWNLDINVKKGGGIYVFKIQSGISS